MTRAAKAARPARCGFSDNCRLFTHAHGMNLFYTAAWKGKPARERDGTLRNFTTIGQARAWLAAADATNGESFRHQCS